MGKWVKPPAGFERSVLRACHNAAGLPHLRAWTHWPPCRPGRFPLDDEFFLLEAFERALGIGLGLCVVIGMLIITSTFRAAFTLHERFWQFLGSTATPLLPAGLLLVVGLGLIAFGWLKVSAWTSGAGIAALCWSAVMYRARPRDDIFKKPPPRA